MVAWNTSGHDVARHLRMLLGQAVQAGLVRRDDVANEGDGFVGLFQTDEGILEASCHLDIPLAAGAGCGLSLLSPRVAQTAVESSDFSPPLVENIHEILNVLGGLKNGAGLPHVMLRQVLRTRDASDMEREEWMQLPLEGSIEVTIALYGSGRMTIRSRA
jgi:hypothetical protein